MPFGVYFIPYIPSENLSLGFGAGIENILNSNPEEPNVYVSGDFELSPLLRSLIKSPGRLSLGLSLCTELPTYHTGNSKIDFGAWLKLRTKIGALFAIAQTEYSGKGEVYNKNNGSAFATSLGIRVSGN